MTCIESLSPPWLTTLQKLEFSSESWYKPSNSESILARNHLRATSDPDSLKAHCVFMFRICSRLKSIRWTQQGRERASALWLRFEKTVCFYMSDQLIEIVEVLSR